MRPKYGPPKIIRMGWGYDSNLIFDANCTQHWRWIYWVQPVIDLGISDWPLGVFWSAPRHLVSSTILRNRWFDWYVALVLMTLTRIQQMKWKLSNAKQKANHKDHANDKNQTRHDHRPLHNVDKTRCPAQRSLSDLHLERLALHWQIAVLTAWSQLIAPRVWSAWIPPPEYDPKS